ncbi:GTPase-activating protein gyp7-like isoform X3 [Actinidia eriantha]|uniref:GTPase-activating protein gyp7-like isoform X3 n=1 Tax=Actinidia eriantha TaxID=165200 RepID=UPI00258A9797|nr:GTPase-activating protein gyp7-like isoform X3 [Actinidia eriantha]
MQEIDLHDLSDDADYADSLQQGASSLTPSDSSKRSSASEPDGAEVVYLKDNVSIHPTQYASERISGRLRLIKQGSSLFMTWIPYKGQNSNARLSERDRNLYTIRAVPFTDVRSIRRHTPTIGWQYIIVVLSSGLAFPPLYFYNGGVRDFLATVKQHAFLVRSAEDANVFLVNDFQDPLQRTLSSLELRRDVSVANGLSSAISAGESPSNEYQQRTEGGTIDGSATDIQHNRRQRQKAQDPARDLSIQVLEKFSRVTRLARETTSQLFRESQSDGFGANESKNHNLTPHQYPSNVSSIDSEKVPSKIPVASDPLEKTSSRKRNNGEEAATNVGTFELIDYKEVDKLTLVWGKPRQPPLGSEEWLAFFDSEGRIMDSKALRKRIFYGGVDNRLREEVWPFLLGYHAYDSTYAEREYLVSVKKSEYETIKRQWQSISTEQAKRFTKFRERKGLIEKDVVRTDRSLSFYDGDDNSNVNLLRDILLTYSFYNFDLGYCQLVELLDIPLHNYFEQNDCLNYFFCFRWVLIQFKREFEFDRTMRLWEVLWTHYLSEHLHLYFCIAILKRYRQKIIGEEMDFDTLLKFINELSGHIDLNATLRDAEALCICAGENGAARIPPGTPPSLPTEVGLLYTQQDDDVL